MWTSTATEDINLENYLGNSPVETKELEKKESWYTRNVHKVASGILGAGMFFSSILPGFTADNYNSSKNLENNLNVKNSIINTINPLKDEMPEETYFLGGDNPPLRGPGDLKEATDAITISGQVSGNPQNNPLPATLYFVNTSAGDTLETTVANAAGFYSVNFYWTGIPDLPKTPVANLRTNPSNKAEIDLVSPKPDEYLVNVTNLQGKTYLNKSVRVEPGNNLITLEGLGQDALDVITLTNGVQKFQYKFVPQNSYGSPAVNVTNATPLKEFDATLDLMVMVRYNGYEDKDTLIENTSQTLDIAMQQIPFQRNIKIKPYTLSGDAITSLTLDFKWKNNEITQHSVGSDGYINVNRNEFTDTTFVAFVTHSNDTATYALWQFFRLSEGHQLKDTNYAQSPKELTLNYPTNYYTEPTATPLNLPAGEETLELDLYLPHTEVAHPMQPGQNIRLDDYEVRYIMGSRGSGMSVKYIDVPAVPRKFVHYQFTFDQANPGTQMPSADLQLAVTERAKILEKFTLNNNKRVFPDDTLATFTSTSDPFYQTIQSQGFAQTAKTTYRTGQNPGNGCSLTTNNSSNGEAIINHSYSAYPAPSAFPIFAELFQQYTYANDPLSGGLAGWVRSSTGEMTDFGEEVLHFLYIANQGSKVH